MIKTVGSGFLVPEEAQHWPRARRFSSAISTRFHRRSRRTISDRSRVATYLASLAVRALLEEVELTPKPALVDERGPGAHTDLSLTLMRRSARLLRSHFEVMALASFQKILSQTLREELGAIGRAAERSMLSITGGVNTHRGAIWTLGLLIAGAAMLTGKEQSAEKICAKAARIARLPDSYTSNVQTHGRRAHCQYGVRGARGEAEGGFRHVVEIGLPMLKNSRLQGLAEEHARLNALVAIIAELNDTCLLHRGGLTALILARRGAMRILDLGGVATDEGSCAMQELHRQLVQLQASPGGSADLLAGVLFLDYIESNLV